MLPQKPLINVKALFQDVIQIFWHFPEETNGTTKTSSEISAMYLSNRNLQCYCYTELLKVQKMLLCTALQQIFFSYRWALQYTR